MACDLTFADVLGIEKYQQAMDNADQELERGDESVRDSF